MSVLGLQLAIAALIRCPDDNRGADLPGFLKTYDLDSREYEIASELAVLPELNKYGREQADQRWELINRTVVRLFHFVDEEVLEDLWFYHFEPQAMTVPSDHKGRYDYSLAFLRFLQTDPAARLAVTEASQPFIMDLISFEIAELELRCPLGIPAQLHADSVITNPYLRVLTLSYDIPAVIQRGPKGQKKLADPMTVVLIRQGARRDPKVYEITKELGAFLLSQSSSAPAAASSKDMVADLKKIGLIGLALHENA